MTEAACTMTISDTRSTALGNVGYPNTAVEVKLEDVPDMGYTHADKPYPRGEVGLLLLVCLPACLLSGQLLKPKCNEM